MVVVVVAVVNVGLGRGSKYVSRNRIDRPPMTVHMLYQYRHSEPTDLMREVRIDAVRVHMRV